MHLQLLTSLLLLPSTIFAYIGGPCSGPHENGNCICLETSTCSDYGGVTARETVDDWSCPDDPHSVAGCYIYPCPEVGNELNNCEWGDSCERSAGGKIRSEPVCPGGDDFVCCQR